MSEVLRIPIILGTARDGRRSEKAARFMLKEATNAGLESEIIDARDYIIGVTDDTEALPQAKKLPELMALLLSHRNTTMVILES